MQKQTEHFPLHMGTISYEIKFYQDKQFELFLYFLC